MDKSIAVLICVLLIVIVFQYWYIRRLRRVIDFAVDCLQRYAAAMVSDDREELERVENDIKNYK